LDKEYLENYERKEKEEHRRFAKMCANGKFGSTDIFPPKERFVKLAEPIAMAVQLTPNLWSQVPFAGSTLVMLCPVAKKQFKEKHGFEASDINRLVDFIKETGKIQFVIDWPPIAFEGLDFLDPIFSELKPPSIPWPSGLFTTNQAQRRLARVEFDTLAGIHFHEFIKKVFAKEISRDKYFLAKRMHDYRLDYLALKELNLQDLLEELSSYMVDDLPRAFQAFLVIGAFITLPMYNTLRATLNYDLNLSAQAQEYVKVENPTFPCEIGKFLIKKLTHYPESLTACQELIAHYEDYDLQKLTVALNEGIKKSNIDLVNVTTKDLSKTLEDIWHDKSIPRKIKGIKVGIPISLAVIGTIVGGPIGTLGGLLGGIGFSVGSTILKVGTDTIGEKTAKIIFRNYQANIFSFKEKHDLK